MNFFLIMASPSFFAVDWHLTKKEKKNAKKDRKETLYTF